MISIIVLSSDGYSDCWDSFFSLLKINFPDIDKNEIILSTNNKDYENSLLKIRTIKHGDIPWSKRLKVSLENSKNDIVLVLVEDFFLFSRIDKKILITLTSLITSTKEIDHIRLLYNKNKLKTIYSKYEYLDEIVPISKHRFLFLPGLWKKNILLKYVVDYETPFMAEKIGNFKSWIYKDGFFAISKEHLKNRGEIFDCGTSGVIIKGKWENWIPERLKENNIKIDFSKRGFKTNETQKKSKKNIRKNMLINPILTLRSFLNVFTILLKEKFKI